MDWRKQLLAAIIAIIESRRNDIQLCTYLNSILICNHFENSYIEALIVPYLTANVIMIY